MRWLAAAVTLLAALMYVFVRSNEIHWFWQVAMSPKYHPPTEYLESPPSCLNCSVILVSLDTLRADRLGKMPHLQKIAAQSLVFTNAYANGYYTTPSHMTVFTSLYPARHRIESKMFNLGSESGRDSSFATDVPEPLSDRFVTWAELMRRNGYETYWNAPPNLRYLRFDYGFNRGFQHFSNPPFGRGMSFNHFPVSGFKKSALDPLKKKGKSFLFLHSYIAHSPYIVHENTERFLQMNVPYNENLLEYFRDRIGSMPEVLILQSQSHFPSKKDATATLNACTRYQDMRECFGSHTTPDAFWHAVGHFQHRKARREIVDLAFEGATTEWKMFEDAYDQAVQELDRQIGEMWDLLRTSGALANTVVVFFSDHGEALFERGDVGHGSFFQEVARIPMIIYHPKIDRRIEIPQLTSLVDLMPATLDILGLPLPAQTQGRIPWKASKTYAFGSSLGSDFITDGRWKLITNNLKQVFFYDLHADPGETLNLVDPWNPLLTREFLRLDDARRMSMIEISL